MDKWCPHCETWKDLSAFAVDRTRRDGHKTQCKACVAAHEKEFRRTHITPYLKPHTRHREIVRTELDENRDKIARQMGLDAPPTGCEGCGARKECTRGMMRGGTAVPALCELSDEDARVPEERLSENHHAGDYPWWIDRKD